MYYPAQNVTCTINTKITLKNFRKLPAKIITCSSQPGQWVDWQGHQRGYPSLMMCYGKEIRKYVNRAPQRRQLQTSKCLVLRRQTCRSSVSQNIQSTAFHNLAFGNTQPHSDTKKPLSATTRVSRHQNSLSATTRVSRHQNSQKYTTFNGLIAIWLLICTKFTIMAKIDWSDKK